MKRVKIVKNNNCENIIEKCNRCSISCNQKPLIDKLRKSDIMFLGISAKIKETEDEIPLSENTNSGKLIKIIEERLKNLKYDWKVLFVGVDKNGTTWRKGE